MTTASATWRESTAEYVLRSPFEAREAIKALPRHARRWDPDDRVWLVDASHAADLRASLAACRIVLTITGGPAAGPTSAPPPPPRPSRGWVEEAFAVCPPGNRARLRAGLLRALHPDVGGDTALAQLINTTADRYAARP